MRIIRSRVVVVLLLCALAGTGRAQRITDLRPTVVLVSLDGFRPDYLGSNTPHLNSLIERGVHVGWMVPSFPTKTFPNHYTIATGLYPEHHGIIANNMLDESLGRFTVGNREQVQNPQWWGGEPIWVTAEKQGVRTAPVFWPGSEAPIGELHPAYWEPYDKQRTAEERVTKLLALLDVAATERPRFLTLYLEDVDDAGHASGPGSDEVRKAVKKVDDVIGNLLAGLSERGITEQVNVIVVSDHGMAPISRKKSMVLDDYIDLKEVEIADWGPPLTLRARDGNNQALVEKLRRVRHAKVYRHGAFPERWHYADSPRILPVLLLPDEGWTINSKEYFDKHPDWTQGGNHGYDNQLKSMRALFIAAGPAFSSHTTLRPFSNVHVYSLMAYLLNLRPAETDGSINVFTDVLVKRGETAPPRTERAPWRKERDEVARATPIY